jgi:UPF0042 nucleotide-binding protein
VVVIITGLSGAGRSTALRALEDLGFYCVDNLPTALAQQVVELCVRADMRRVALGMDVRVREFLGEIGSVINAIEEAVWGRVELVFCDASDEALLRRFNETRRPHPLGTTGEGALAVLDGVRIERERLAPLRARATRVIDTTNLSVHELRRSVIGQFGPASGGASGMVTRFVSFGFKYGLPVDADVVLDVRFLENPFFVRELRDLPGTDARVERYVLDAPETKEFVVKAQDLLRFTLPRCEREGKSYLTVAVGCTGGRHRSVAIAAALAQALSVGRSDRMFVLHRDVDRGELGAADRGSRASLGRPVPADPENVVAPESVEPSRDGAVVDHELMGATSAPPPPHAMATRGGAR